MEDVRNEKLPTFLFNPPPPSFFLSPTIRLVHNEAFHMKLFFSVSAGVQLGGCRRRWKRWWRERGGGVKLEESHD